MASLEALGLGRADGPWSGASSAASGMGADIWTSGLRWPSGVQDEIVTRKREPKGGACTKGMLRRALEIGCDAKLNVL